jgi:hypothetical protein
MKTRLKTLEPRRALWSLSLYVGFGEGVVSFRFYRKILLVPEMRVDDFPGSNTKGWFY